MARTQHPKWPRRAKQAIFVAQYGVFPTFDRSTIMGNKLVTEADRKATPPLPGAVKPRQGAGQRVSLERGSHTRSKKKAGKRAHQG